MDAILVPCFELMYFSFIHLVLYCFCVKTSKMPWDLIMQMVKTCYLRVAAKWSCYLQDKQLVSWLKWAEEVEKAITEKPKEKKATGAKY